MGRVAVIACVTLAGCQFSARAAAGDGAVTGDASHDDGDAAPDALDAPIDAPDPAALAVLNGQHWLIPCVMPLGNQNCRAERRRASRW